MELKVETIDKYSETGALLHAFIIAESLSIAAKIIPSRNEYPFEYEDYVLSTGGNKIKFYDTIAQAIKGTELTLSEYYIESMLRSFPIDNIL